MRHSTAQQSLKCGNFDQVIIPFSEATFEVDTAYLERELGFNPALRV